MTFLSQGFQLCTSRIDGYFYSVDSYKNVCNYVKQIKKEMIRYPAKNAKNCINSTRFFV